MDIGKNDPANKNMKIFLYFLIFAVTAFFVVTLFKKQMAGDKAPVSQAPKESGMTSKKEQKLIDERIALAKQGFSDALDGKISAVGADKKSLKVKPDASEQLDENKTMDVVITDKTKIIKSNMEYVPNKTGDKDDDSFIAKGKTETVGSNALQAGMVVQVQTAEMLEFKNQSSITAVQIVIVEQTQPRE
ncbi:MAG: hypothetical protein AAB487_02155 [Patescibacteria group bacterium]